MITFGTKLTWVYLYSRDNLWYQTNLGLSLLSRIPSLQGLPQVIFAFKDTFSTRVTPGYLCFQGYLLYKGRANSNLGYPHYQGYLSTKSKPGCKLARTFTIKDTMISGCIIYTSGINNINLI